MHALSLSAESFIQAIAEWFDLRIGDYDAPVYRREVRVNSDYRRSDDVLRMVFDCTSAQRHAIELAAAHDRGDIVYGMHRSDSALMTCFLFGLKDFAAPALHRRDRRRFHLRRPRHESTDCGAYRHALNKPHRDGHCPRCLCRHRGSQPPQQTLAALVEKAPDWMRNVGQARPLEASEAPCSS